MAAHSHEQPLAALPAADPPFKHGWPPAPVVQFEEMSQNRPLNETAAQSHTQAPVVPAAAPEFWQATISVSFAPSRVQASATEQSGAVWNPRMHEQTQPSVESTSVVVPLPEQSVAALHAGGFEQSLPVKPFTHEQTQPSVESASVVLPLPKQWVWASQAGGVEQLLSVKPPVHTQKQPSVASLSVVAPWPEQSDAASHAGGTEQSAPA